MIQASPFEITDLPHGGKVASNGAQRLQVIDEGSKVWRRRAIKRAGSEAAEAVEWAVAELDGVRVYFNGTDCILTRQDMYP